MRQIELRESSTQIPTRSPIHTGPLRDHHPTLTPLLRPPSRKVRSFLSDGYEFFAFAQWPSKPGLLLGQPTGKAYDLVTGNPPISRSCCVPIADLDVKEHRETAYTGEPESQRGNPGFTHSSANIRHLQLAKDRIGAQREQGSVPCSRRLTPVHSGLLDHPMELLGGSLRHPKE
jgi:hypothetical protein